jgi:molybdopterin/thiamine biosynthesis adenylyltransferase
MARHQFRLTGQQVADLYAHLFPGDGNEAVALVLCGRLNVSDMHVLCAHRLLFIPHDRCHERGPLTVCWPAELGYPIYEEAMRKHMAVLKIHSHPGYYRKFSEVDDRSDVELFSSLHGWTDDGLPHASAIMLPNKEILARVVTADLRFVPMDRVLVAGDDISFFDFDPPHWTVSAKDLRTAQAFGEKTVGLLNSLRVGVVGCSGTGSWVIEQLARLGVGGLILVDPDLVEHKNLNRIVNSTLDDAEKAKPKVLALKAAIETMGTSTRVTARQASLFDDGILRELATCDLLFGCMDTLDGRDILNRLATFYTIPYFDLGVRLDADGHGSVDVACGSVHYLVPGGSSLLSRRAYTPEALRAATLHRINPEQFKSEVAEGYIKGIKVASPAVISVNGLCATIAINNLLTRLHPFRIDSNSGIRHQWFDLVNGIFGSGDGEGPCRALQRYAGRGDMSPFMDCYLG